MARNNKNDADQILEGQHYPATLFRCPLAEHPIQFALCLKYKTKANEMKIVNYLRGCGAKVGHGLSFANEYTAVIVDHNEVLGFYGPAFTLDYIYDCFRCKKLLNISNYRQEATGHILKDFDCMRVVHLRLQSWLQSVTADDLFWSETAEEEMSLAYDSNLGCLEDETEPENISDKVKEPHTKGTNEGSTTKKKIPESLKAAFRAAFAGAPFTPKESESDFVLELSSDSDSDLELENRNLLATQNREKRVHVLQKKEVEKKNAIRTSPKKHNNGQIKLNAHASAAEQETTNRSETEVVMEPSPGIDSYSDIDLELLKALEQLAAEHDAEESDDDEMVIRACTIQKNLPSTSAGCSKWNQSKPGTAMAPSIMINSDSGSHSESENLNLLPTQPDKKNVDILQKEEVAKKNVCAAEQDRSNRFKRQEKNSDLGYLEGETDPKDISHREEVNTKETNEGSTTKKKIPESLKTASTAAAPFKSKESKPGIATVPSIVINSDSGSHLELENRNLLPTQPNKRNVDILQNEEVSKENGCAAEQEKLNRSKPGTAMAPSIMINSDSGSHSESENRNLLPTQPNKGNVDILQNEEVSKENGCAAEQEKLNRSKTDFVLELSSDSDSDLELENRNLLATQHREKRVDVLEKEEVEKKNAIRTSPKKHNNGQIKLNTAPSHAPSAEQERTNQSQSAVDMARSLMINSDSSSVLKLVDSYFKNTQQKKQSGNSLQREEVDGKRSNRTSLTEQKNLQSTSAGCSKWHHSLPRLNSSSSDEESPSIKPVGLKRKEKFFSDFDIPTDDDSPPRQRKKNISVVEQSKRTRAPYTVQEKENILKYITKHGEYHRIKGNEIWKIMERRQVCPRRTWQSMKEHFLKAILPRIDSFIFLTDEMKRKFKRK